MAHCTLSGALPTANETRSATSAASSMVFGPVQAISIGTGGTSPGLIQRIAD